MERFRSCLNKAKSSAALAVLCSLPLWSAAIPAGTPLELRLKSKIASNTARAKDAIEAVLIAPVVVGGAFVVPAGATVRGVVREVKPCPGPTDRAVLALDFTEIETGGKKIPLAASVAAVDNAREPVDEKGRILGILASETISARLDAGISAVAQKYAGLAGVLGAAKGSVLKATEGDILYEPGVEFTIRLAQPLEVEPQPGAAPKLDPVPGEARLVEMVVAQPFQTTAQNPPKPSDITNLMYIGSEDAVRKTFAAAGWSAAAALSTQSKLETFRAIAELRGYKEAPVSILLLDGKPPDLVFQKQNNTFAMRHHLRIWRRPADFDGKPVWVCAATHDTGIDFSQENRTFIHTIDPYIDTERAKVVNDLLLTGLVRSLALVDRPAVPRESQNATGDKLITDGHMAVLILK